MTFPAVLLPMKTSLLVATALMGAATAIRGQVVITGYSADEPPVVGGNLFFDAAVDTGKSITTQPGFDLRDVFGTQLSTAEVGHAVFVDGSAAGPVQKLVQRQLTFLD